MDHGSQAGRDARPTGSPGARAPEGRQGGPLSYTFGDTDLAAERLALVAEVFGDPSRRLAIESIPCQAGIVLDLGCGPGHTTRMLADACSADRVIGVDVSERFVSLARRLTTNPRITFASHDVTHSPLPGAPADAIYARFLLTHLASSLDVVDAWRCELRPGGVIVIDELEDIQAPPGPLRDYLDLSAEVVATGGGAMYAGALLRPLGGLAVEHFVEAAVAARMFAMNLQTWRETAIEHRLADNKRLNRLAAELDDLAAGSNRDPVRWLLRQVVLSV